MLGYVEKSGFDKYRSTGQIRRLIARTDEHRLLAAAALPLQQLHAKTKETINLGVLRTNRVAYLQVLESPHPLRRVAALNTLDYVHSTALGRVILAYLPEAQRDLLLRGPLEQRTPHTVVDPKKVKQIVQKAAEQGFAIERDQTDLGVTCIGAPVFESGSIIAAISISLPTARIKSARETSLIKAVCSTARRVEKNLRSRRTTR